MHGRRTLRSSQSRHSVHEWLDRVGHALWHRHLRNVLRLFGPAVHGKDEGTVAPSGFIALAQQRSEEHTSELQSLMRISYAVFCLKKKKSNMRYIQPHK